MTEEQAWAELEKLGVTEVETSGGSGNAEWSIDVPRNNGIINYVIVGKHHSKVKAIMKVVEQIRGMDFSNK